MFCSLDRTSGLIGATAWPPRLPALAFPNILVLEWGSIKCLVYLGTVSNIKELRHRLVAAHKEGILMRAYF